MEQQAWFYLSTTLSSRVCRSGKKKTEGKKLGLIGISSAVQPSLQQIRSEWHTSNSKEVTKALFVLHLKLI